MTEQFWFMILETNIKNQFINQMLELKSILTQFGKSIGILILAKIITFTQFQVMVEL